MKKDLTTPKTVTLKNVGTEEVGLLYLSTPITIEIGKRINLTYK